MNYQLTKHINDVDAFLKYCQVQKYTAKTTVVRAGDASDTLYYVVDGSVTVWLEDDDGKEMIVAYINKGEFFGELGLFGVGDSRCASVKTKTPCEIAQISYTDFSKLVDANPGYLFDLSTQIAKRLHETTQKVSDLAFLDVTGRVARTLLDLCKQPDAMTHPDGMQIKITRQDIGRIVGCSREMAGRVLKILEDQGLVAVSGKTMVVFNTR